MRMLRFALAIAILLTIATGLSLAHVVLPTITLVSWEPGAKDQVRCREPCAIAHEHNSIYLSHDWWVSFPRSGTTENSLLASLPAFAFLPVHEVTTNLTCSTIRFQHAVYIGRAVNTTVRVVAIRGSPAGTSVFNQIRTTYA